jgi:hypothetical protein
VTPADTFNAWVNGLAGWQACALVALWAISTLGAAYWFARRDTR